MNRFSAKPKRVAIVYHFFAHYRAPVLRELLATGAHDYLLFASRKEPQANGIKGWSDIDPARFTHTPCYYPVKNVLLQRGVARLAFRRDIDSIIYLGDAHYITTWISAAVARMLGKRVLYWTHGWTRDERDFKDHVRSLFFRLAHGLLLYGNRAKKVAVKRGFAPEALYVIYNSLNYHAQKSERERVTPEMITQVRSALFSHPDRAVLICSARLTPERELQLLLEAMNHLARLDYPVNLILIGDGPDRAKLESFAGERKLAVQFIGACYDEPTIARLTMAADVTVVPGATGLTAIQSLTYGTPVITHGNWDLHGPEYEAIVPGKTGAFFRQGDTEDLAHVIKDWLQRGVPINAVRAQCHEIIERFYNPTFQRLAIDRAVSGLPAVDVCWHEDLQEIQKCDRYR